MVLAVPNYLDLNPPFVSFFFCYFICIIQNDNRIFYSSLAAGKLVLKVLPLHMLGFKNTSFVDYVEFLDLLHI